ncbi:MAG: UDP-N-acetylmuramoyl-tripeptide--D-alanyl-D-alanine ligase [Verrucomicrobiota bacterium]
MSKKLDVEKLAEWTGGRWLSSQPGSIGGICHDTRSLDAGDVYVALKGERFDGHDFVEDAFEKGAAASIVNDNWRGFFDWSNGNSIPNRPLLQVPDTTRALMDMGRGYRDELDIKVVGITGSAGKTTTKELTADMLSSRYHVGRTIGNWNNKIGVPLSMLGLPENTEVGVLEVGTNHPGELRPLCAAIRPEVGLITTIAPVHVEHFASLEAIAEEKAELIRALPPEGVAIMPEPVASFDAVRAALNCRLLTVGIGEGSGYRCVSLDREKWLAKIHEVATGEDAEIEVPVPGEHNLMNLMIAVAAARHYMAPWESVRAAIRAYRPPRMRWEARIIASRKVINDAYNANPLSMRAAIDTFLSQNHKKRWLILGGMAELGKAEASEHLRLGQYIGLKCWDGVILIGEPGEKIAEGIRITRGATKSVYVAENNRQAAEIAAENVAKRAEILLKGSRFVKMETIVEDLLEIWERRRVIR